MLVTTTGALCPSYEESPVDEAVAPQADAHGDGGLEVEWQRVDLFWTCSTLNSFEKGAH